MGDKKHIDRVFQEKFKDFEATPNPEVWANLQKKLNKQEKDRKKAFPFWYKLAGVAALLLLLLTIGGLLNTENPIIESNKTKVVDTENTLKVKDSNKSSTKPNTNSIIENTSNEKNSASSDDYSNTQISNKNSNRSQIASDEEAKTKSFNQRNKLLNNEYLNKNITNPSSKTHTKDTRITKNTNSNNQVNSKESPDNITNQITDKNPIENKNNIALNQTNRKDSKSGSDVKFDQTKTDKQLHNLNNKPVDNQIVLDKNIESEIEKPKTEELINTDLTIEEAIAANEDLIKKESDEILNRWQVYANIAPVYYNSMGKGSHIDQQFTSNSKSGEVNTSYGVNVSYNLNEKLSVRTGLSSLNLSYDTNDVVLYKTLASVNSASNSLKNINLSNGNEGLTALSADNFSVSQVDNLLSPKSNAAISQRISYYEIPMELNYRIGSKKLGLNIIAGFSSFILDDNNVYSELQGEKTYIGEANNIKNLSFSTNLGVGIDYKFSEKFKFNLEPTFKYQLNAFENTAGNFNPYIIGIYTGFSYKF
ncbi:MAG TPA: hypothetical protein VKY41_05045 [Xanthomarina sp.]|nr:hypothetical protein [Xanthomarina sp.]